MAPLALKAPALDGVLGVAGAAVATGVEGSPAVDNAVGVLTPPLGVLRALDVVVGVCGVSATAAAAAARAA